MSIPAGTDLWPLFDGLVDDAALFPPGNAPMPDAVTGHLARRSGPWAPLVGRFLCPASRRELTGELDGRVGADDSLRLGIIADTGLAGLPAALDVVTGEPRLALELVEIPLPRDAEGEALLRAARVTVGALPEVEGYVELPRRRGWEQALAVVADSAYGAKLRTGGLTAELFPSEAEVAAFVLACVALETPFKCTAGLHSALRHTDPATGFEHHGFLNLLVATAEATQGADRHTVEDVLAERDGSVLAGAARALDPTRIAVTRSFLVAYGSCSIDEPVADLRALGLLPGPDGAPATPATSPSEDRP